MIGELRELWRFRELLFAMVQRELKIRYKNSALGFVWSFITPLATTIVLMLVFRYFGGIQVENYGMYVLAALLPFLFIQQSILDSSQSVLGALPIVKKVYFPREILPLATIISNFVHFLISLGVFFLLQLAIWIAYPKIVPFQVTALLLPVFLAISFALATGLGLIAAALNTFYEDVKYILSVALYLLFYLCPIIYFSENVYHAQQQHFPGNTLYYLFHLNPVAMLCVAYRKILVAPQDVRIPKGNEVFVAEWMPLNWGLVAITAVVSFATLLFGYHLFNRLKWRFVERP